MRVDVNEFRLELKKLLGLNNGVLKIPIHTDYIPIGKIPDGNSRIGVAIGENQQLHLLSHLPRQLSEVPDSPAFAWHISRE
jgi:hypothetical protein